MKGLEPYTFGPKGFKRDDNAMITIPLSTYEAMLEKIARLEHEVYVASWGTNPDRMGS
jgi:hypothetical protein